jgi:hypothetical protein
LFVFFFFFSQSFMYHPPKTNRFAKCRFCVDWRAISKQTGRMMEANERLELHRMWANIRERGWWKTKVDLATQEPLSCLSMSMDGTDKFPNGFPHFWEMSKGDTVDRIKLHLDISIVHGSKPRIFIADESIRSDPNLTFEVFYRTLLAEQAIRGVLPRVLYLQLDNCIRENKNTTFFGGLCWLIERGIVDKIFVSFLPVGHTHFDCDAVASRISLALKYKDVTNFDELHRTLAHCCQPAPTVESIDDVGDLKALLNPSGLATFPVGSSRIRRFVGCCTKVLPKERANFMYETSPLHWQFRKDTAGKVVIQSKLTCDDRQWSEMTYPWTTSAPRPDDRAFEPDTSGLRPSDLRLAPRRPISADRRAELKRALSSARFRISEPDWRSVEAAWKKMLGDDQPAPSRSPPNAGLFIGESDDPEQRQPEPAPVQPMAMRPQSRLFTTTNLANKDRENRKKRGRADTDLVIGKMITTTGNYSEECLDEHKQDFWVAKILDLVHNEELVHVQWFNTGQLQNATKKAQYRVWTGQHPREWIPISRVLHQFEALTEKNKMIKSADIRHTMNSIECNLLENS